jgi:hypothetical protein
MSGLSIVKAMIVNHNMVKFQVAYQAYSVTIVYFISSSSEL